jgi:DNA-binding NarL/FixJ family response regulator
VTDHSRWPGVAAAVPAAAPAGRPVRVPYPAPTADQLAFPIAVTVVGQPARGRDELVQALTTCSLLRLRVTASTRADQPVLVPAGGGGSVHTGQFGGRPAAPRPWRAGDRHRPARSAVVVLRSTAPARDVRALVSADETAPVLVVSPETEENEVVRTLQSGATSYLVEGQFTGTEVLAAALGTAAGRSHLSPPVLAAVVRRLQHPDRSSAAAELAGSLSRRERQIMELVAEGHPNSYIARREFIAEKTVRNHLNNIYAKLGVRSRAEAILVWLGRARPAAG